jgi:thiamine biosynthesis lipoprotein
MATSGNYRNFRYIDGKKVAHTIDPLTGYPVNHNLLSATVIADDCATADALATAFMVMGLEKALAFCEKNRIEALFIYSDDDGNLLTKETEKFAKYQY